jgi:hypothetical protein
MRTDRAVECRYITKKEAENAVAGPWALEGYRRSPNEWKECHKHRKCRTRISGKMPVPKDFDEHHCHPVLPRTAESRWHNP